MCYSYFHNYSGAPSDRSRAVSRMCNGRSGWCSFKLHFVRFFEAHEMPSKVALSLCRLFIKGRMWNSAGVHSCKMSHLLCSNIALIYMYSIYYLSLSVQTDNHQFCYALSHHYELQDFSLVHLAFFLNIFA